MATRYGWYYFSSGQNLLLLDEKSLQRLMDVGVCHGVHIVERGQRFVVHRIVQIEIGWDGQRG